MAVSHTQNKAVKDFLVRLRADYPQFKFRRGEQDHWSPGSNTITYNEERPLMDLEYGLLHELAHALLNHKNYTSDFELLKLESEAWETARTIAMSYGIEIHEEHIQNSLDTYRDWLHLRSSCPKCGVHVFQKDTEHYMCFNCQTSWSVGSDRFVRTYRKVSSKKDRLK